MPARIIVVHGDLRVLESTVGAIKAAGFDALAFSDSLSAIDAIDAIRVIHRLELLITGVAFAPGKPHGIALARMAKSKSPGVKVLFLAPPNFDDAARTHGAFLPLSSTSTEVVEAVRRLLAGGG